MPPHIHWIHWPNLSTVQASYPSSLVSFADPYLQWRPPYEVLLKNQDSMSKNDKADGMPDAAAAHIMNDDLEGAEAGLANGNSSFHKVC